MALTHELLHAYDHCRAANLNWTNCEHHACSEVHRLLAALGMFRPVRRVDHARLWRESFFDGSYDVR